MSLHCGETEERYIVSVYSLISELAVESVDLFTVGQFCGSIITSSASELKGLFYQRGWRKVQNRLSDNKYWDKWFSPSFHLIESYQLCSTNSTHYLGFLFFWLFTYGIIPILPSLDYLKYLDCVIYLPTYKYAFVLQTLCSQDEWSIGT